jgi:hypothetical protein
VRSKEEGAPAEEPLQIYGGTIISFEVKELTPSEQMTAKPLGLGDRGYSIFRTQDFDWSYKPWLVLLTDKSIWIQAGPGEPAGGRTAEDFACLVSQPNACRATQGHRGNTGRLTGRPVPTCHLVLPWIPAMRGAIRPPR